jgi:hypothetical protein
MHVVCLCAPVSEFKFIFGCALFFFIAILMLEQVACLHQVKDSPCSWATKGTMPSCPQRFFRNFSKNSDNFVETNCTSEKFFDGNSNSRKVKVIVCMRWRDAYSFKAPSANAPVATTRRLASTSLVSGFHSTPSRERSSDHLDFGPKEEFAQLKPQLSPEPLEDPGAVNEWLSLAVRRGQALRLLCPYGSGARLNCFVSLSSTARWCGRPRALGSDREITSYEKPSYTITWQRVQIITNSLCHV